ncbi:MAG: radical SAM protein [Ignavibacteria bacterium]|nr:radical SAM protein [Ignavibacteria bacterium]
MITFGPIPSRRLGRSLGINNIPPKICSYSCIYCQIGKTNTMSVQRKEFYPPEQIFREVIDKVKELNKKNETIDYLTFVPDGEPTLDISLGKTILLLKKLNIKIAVITNSSLLWDEKVRDDLSNADWVSVKVDTVDEHIWHKIDRPNRRLKLPDILNGISDFSKNFKGTLVTETMLVKNVNDFNQNLIDTSRMIEKIHASKSYILVPTRPPAEDAVYPPSEEKLNEAFQIYNNLLKNVEIISSNEGLNFSFSSEAEQELLSILSVHPMRKDAMENFLIKAGAGWSLAENLINNNIIKMVEYSDEHFFVRILKK